MTISRAYLQVTTDDVGAFRVPATGLAGGSASIAFTAALTEAVIAVWDASLSITGTVPLTGTAKAVSTLDMTHPGATEAYDYIVTVLGLDEMPASYTYADYRDVAAVVVPPTRITRASATNGASLPQWVHCHPIYAVIVTSTTAHAGAGGAIKSRFRFQNHSDIVA